MSPQITAITQLEKEKTQPVKNALIAASRSKNPGARLAAAEALATFKGSDTRDALIALLDDSKENVRLTASAAYIRLSQDTSTNRPASSHTTKPGSPR